MFAFKGIVGEQQRAHRLHDAPMPKRQGNPRRFDRRQDAALCKEVLGLDAQGRPLDRLAISPDEAKLLLRIFRLYADGYSLKGICDILAEDGMPSPRAREGGKYNAGF